jgi:curved DNA-binding protein CbpA
VQNLYDVLGVPRTATAAEIDAAYRRIAKATHPDLHGDSPENLKRFRAATEAYSILSDSSQRARYDATDSFDQAQAAARMAELIATIAAIRAQAAELKQAAKAEVI